MNALTHIRANVFQMTQREFAQVIGASQSTVSRMEKGELFLDTRHQKKIRAIARERGVEWQDSWFFEEPVQ